MAEEAEVESYKVKMRCGKKYTGGKREEKPIYLHSKIIE